MLLVCGEALMDIVTDAGDTSKLSAYVGGGPLNVAMAYAKLGGEAGFLHPLSEDDYGNRINAYLAENNIAYLCPYRSPCPTPLALTYIGEDNKADYRFYRQKTAERDLRLPDMLGALPEKIDFFHSGTLAIAESPDADVTLSLAREAKARGACISLDPNIRADNFASADSYRQSVFRCLSIADIIKLSDDDMAFLYPQLSDEGDSDSALLHMRRDFTDASLLVMTRGSGDMSAMAGDKIIRRAAGGKPIKGDTIGAGDCFIAALLFAIRRANVDVGSLTVENMTEFLSFADEIAALNCDHFGCYLPKF